MPSRIQSGETGRNWQQLEGTGQSSSVVRLASAFFRCQTVFWQRRYPHIRTGLRETGISSRYCTEEEGEKKKELYLSHVPPTPKLLTSTPQFCFSALGQVCCAVLNAGFEEFGAFSRVKVTVP